MAQIIYFEEEDGIVLDSRDLTLEQIEQEYEATPSTVMILGTSDFPSAFPVDRVLVQQ